MTQQEIEQKIQEISKSIAQTMDEMYDLDYDQFLKAIEKERNELQELYRELRLVLEPHDRGDATNPMTLEEFKTLCENGSFVDTDGFGEYVKDGKLTDISIIPSDVTTGKIRDDCTHVQWYNK